LLGIFAVAVFISLLFFLAMFLFPLEYDYSKRDWLRYHLTTPTEVKAVPGLDDEAIIHFYAQDGTRPESYEIEFKEPQEREVLEEYLRSLGYRKNEKSQLSGGLHRVSDLMRPILLVAMRA
jgi:hypothetical protein